MGNIILLETVTLLPFSDTNCEFRGLCELLRIVFKLASEYEIGFQTKKAKLYGDLVIPSI